MTWHAWEPTLERPPAEAFDGVDGVVNLLGEKINQRWTAESKRRILESRRTGTRNLAQAIAGLKRKPRYSSTSRRSASTGTAARRSSTSRLGPGRGLDAEVVREWEKAAREVESTGLRLVIVRTGHVLDPSGGLLTELLIPFKLGVGGPLAGGNQYMSWIHIDDEVGILLWALDDDKVRGVVNSTAPNPATNREFSKAIGRAVGRPAIVPVPGLILDLKFGSEFGAVLRGGQRVMPRRALDLGYEFRHPHLDEALGDLL